jgi:LPXTG-motif cell wall-anchored protein
MKKILFTIALLLVISVGAMAQNNDAFFNDWENSLRISDPSIVGLMMPNTNIGDISNSPAPLGGGLLVLTALGGAYAVSRKRKNN